MDDVDSAWFPITMCIALQAKKGSRKMKVFMGGTCNESDWRDIDRCVMRGLKGREMEIERADPDRIEVLGGKPGDKERCIEIDFRIRSGLCPNGHGLMTMGGWGQECPTCGFTCNTMPDTPNGADA